jgi:hypothetical protein
MPLYLLFKRLKTARTDISMFALKLFAPTALGGFFESPEERHIQCQIRGCSSALKTLKNWEICSLRQVTERRCRKSADRIAGPCRFPGNLPPITSDSGYVSSSLKFGQFPEFWHPVLSLVLDFQSIANGYEIADDCWWGGCVSAKSVVAPDEEDVPTCNVSPP